jgi:excisionase family DNA binding protein
MLSPDRPFAAQLREIARLKPTLTVLEAKKLLGLHNSTLYAWMKKGLVRSYRLPRPHGRGPQFIRVVTTASLVAHYESIEQEASL